MKLSLQRLLGGFDTSKLNIKPTWGVSFGLPQGGGSYPVNPYGPNPYPGYGNGGNGLDLGLLSVNPLVALQVSKDEYGEKVVKPFVNLHVTPNKGLVHKIGDILAYKKQELLGGHGGYHPGGHYSPHSYPPPIYQNPHYYEKPQQHYHQHEHNYPSWSGSNHGQNYYNEPHGGHYGQYGDGNYGGQQYGGYYSRDNVDYDDEDYNDFSRNTKPNSTVENKSGNKVAFRDRKRRDVDEVANIQEVREEDSN